MGVIKNEMSYSYTCFLFKIAFATAVVIVIFVWSNKWEGAWDLELFDDEDESLFVKWKKSA